MRLEVELSGNDFLLIDVLIGAVGFCMKSVLRRSESSFDRQDRSRFFLALAVLLLIDFDAGFMLAYLF